MRVFSDRPSVQAPGVGPIEERRKGLEHGLFVEEGYGFAFLNKAVVEGPPVLLVAF